MRYLPLLFLLFPLFASAQVDLDKISLTSDSTFVKVSSDKDTTYYVFQVKEKKTRWPAPIYRSRAAHPGAQWGEAYCSG
jgi:hypothetical protein